MFFAIFLVVIAVSFASPLTTKPTMLLNCSPSMLGCLCQDLNNITAIEVAPCCDKNNETLIITGALVKDVSVDIGESKCAKTFVNLIIRETGLVKFYSALKGLSSINYINIERNQYLSDFYKLIFEEINPDIENIFVEFNSFRTISKKTFANLRKLNTLRLSDNKIGYIEERSFSGLTGLNLLYLNNNILTQLTSDVFLGLDSLTVLSLLSNPLQEPKSPDLFKHLKNLKHLLMSHGSGVELPALNQLPAGLFFSIKQLRTLNMTSIRLKNLTATTFYGLNDLERLDLQGNRLTVIPSGTLQQVPKISSINLSKNQLLCLLSDTFHNLPRLIILDLSHNELSYISDDVFSGLSKLQTLDLAENNIYVIDRNAFATLYSLMIIKLNVIHGRAKNEIQTDFLTSSLAKLRNTTKIIGLMEYFGVSTGMNIPAEQRQSVINGSHCPVASNNDKDWNDLSATGSRKYLLIIVGICVMFLLVAFAIIMTYRAWSKRKMGEIAFDEKQEMLQSKNCLVNGSLDNAMSKSNQYNRKSINEHEKDLNSAQPQHCHSDDESALTPLGVL